MDSVAPRDATTIAAVNHGSRPVIVGIDGSGVAVRAAQWATAEASARGAPLLLVHVMAPGVGSAFPPGDSRLRYAVHTLDIARRAVLARRADTARSADTVGIGQQSVVAHIILGRPGPVLIELSRSAGTVVVGSTGTAVRPHKLLGSAAMALTREAHCPVVLIPTSYQPDSVVGPVLAPVAASSPAEPVLTAAFRAAQLRGSELLVARIREHRPRSVNSATACTDSIGAQILRCRQVFPAVADRSLSVIGVAEAAIEQLSYTTQLIVVTHAEHPMYRTTRLDFLAHAIVFGAHCPVQVVPRPGVGEPT